MYDRTFGTDWTDDTLNREEAIDRAFALGVAAGCGSERPAELDRVLEAFPSTYDQSIVELAYDEGRTKALEAPAEDPERVWKRLVDDTGTPRQAPVPAALPGAINELTLLDRPRTGAPSSLELPSFLRK